MVCENLLQNIHSPIMQEKGTKVRDKISSYPLVLRWSIYYAGILAIIILGIYGSGHAGNGFVYMYY